MKLSLLQVGNGSACVLLLLLPCMFPLAASSGQSKVIPVSDSNVLQQYLCGTNDQQVLDNTVLELTSPSYVLGASDLCLVSDRHNIGIISNLNKQPVISCTTKGGLGFFNVNVLNITNVKIQSCGAAILPLTDRIGATTGLYLPDTSHASLAIVDSSAVSLSTITITEYNGYAILAINVYGVSVLSDLMITEKTDLINAEAGSGVMVYYHNSTQASLSISNSQFVENQFLLSSYCLSEILSQNTPIPTPYAAALSVVYNQVSQNVSVTLSNCSISSNIGCPIPGVLVLYFDSSPNVTTVITDSLISANQNVLCKCRGTGLAMVTYFSANFAIRYEKSLSVVSNWTYLSVLQTNISHHLGEFNGETQSNEISGVVYLSTSQIGLLIHVVFQNVNFEYNNAADVGTCLYAETILSSDNNSKKSLAVHLIDVFVDGNIHIQDSTSYMYMPGAIMTFVQIAYVEISSTEEGKTVFSHNLGSAVEAYNSNVYMSGTVFFEYNFASNGAALLLLGQSYLFLYPNLSAHFNSNVFKFGGAIYSYNDATDNLCTFQVLCNNLSISPLVFFENNIVSVGHSSVSANSLYDCKQIHLDIKPSYLPYLYKDIFHFQKGHNKFLNMSSNPVRIVPCIKEEPQLINTNTLLSTLKTYPGKKFNISLAALNSKNEGLHSLQQVQVKFREHVLQQASSWWLSGCEYEQLFDRSATCTNFSLTIHTKQLDDNDLSFGYSIATALFSFPEEAPTYQALIKLQNCPPGFQLNNVTGICNCSSLIKKMNRDYGFYFTCDIQNSVVSAPDIGPWIGCNNKSEGQHCEVGISPFCFPGF